MKVLIIGGGFAGCASAEILSHMKNAKINIVEKVNFWELELELFFMVDILYIWSKTLSNSKKKEAYNYIKKFLKFHNCNNHQFISYVEKDNQWYNYPINTKDIERMPDKKKLKKN